VTEPVSMALKKRKVHMLVPKQVVEELKKPDVSGSSGGAAKPRWR